MLKKIALVVLVLVGAQAFADLEIRGQFGTMPKEGGNLNGSIENTVSSNPNVTSITTLGGDVIFKIPLIPIAIGARYESLSGSASGQGTVSSNAVTANPKISGSRTLALLSFRPLSTPIGYLGVIGHYALQKSLKLTEKTTQTSNGASNEYDFSGNVPSSYGAGLEAGLVFGGFTLGLEGGYTSFKLQNATDSTGQITGSSTMDLSGMYLRASLGLSFF